MSIAFYLTRSVRTIEHYLIYIECIESIKKHDCYAKNKRHLA